MRCTTATVARGYPTPSAGGYSNWGHGNSSNRGPDSYGAHSDGGYRGGYGTSGSGLTKRGFSGGSVASPTGTNADVVIAKINQRLDMLTQMEGGMKRGSRGDRFDQYESFDSRPSLIQRDLYRSGNYGYSEGQRGGAGPGGGGYEGSSSYGSTKPQLVRQPRDSFPGPAWAGQPSPGGRVRGPGGPGFGRWQEPSMGGGPGSHFPGGRGKPPSLLSHHVYPEMGVYRQGPGPQDIPGIGHFGGGAWAGHQRGRKRPVNRVKPEKDVRKKRRLSPSAADEPDPKTSQAETGDGEPTNEVKEPGEKAEESKASQEGMVAVEGDALMTQDDTTQVKKNLEGQQQQPLAQDKVPKQRKRNTRFLERSGVIFNAQRMMFACSVCKYRSFYKDDMDTHLESRFHKEQFKFLSSKLSKPTTDFLQEYLNDKYKKTELRRNHIDDINAAICQMYEEQDLTRDLGMEHFMRKVEAAHCAACNLFIPMQHHLIQRHLRSPDHNFNRRGMMEQSKRASLSVARSILNHKVISRKLELFLKGENPFNTNPDDQDLDNSLMVDVPESDLVNDGHGEENQGTEEANVCPSEELGTHGIEEKAEKEEGVDSQGAAEKESLLEELGSGNGEEEGVNVVEGEEGDVDTVA
ncbi:A-kinase anchor protein 8-like isoform X2 [Scleropages formosus]|uniref:A-kinase anchor protein 8-like isoform X2 n=1 Tax=Scleropages formosus TaxID=113540 RepID=UPI0008782659|nr:A-kinase anchor protein 8-like isoform X2 [Scleropages formosus]